MRINSSLFVLLSFPIIGSVSSSSVMWSQTYGGGLSDLASSLVETSDGGYIIAGETRSFSRANNDFWLVKTDSYGRVAWN